MRLLYPLLIPRFKTGCSELGSDLFDCVITSTVFGYTEIQLSVLVIGSPMLLWTAWISTNGISQTCHSWRNSGLTWIHWGCLLSILTSEDSAMDLWSRFSAQTSIPGLVRCLFTFILSWYYKERCVNKLSIFERHILCGHPIAECLTAHRHALRGMH